MLEVYVATRAEWREWLAKNHDQHAAIWLVFYKKDSQKPSLNYDESVEEALCFGWIDSIIKKLDDERYARKFTPRKPDSRWSESNKERVGRLIAQGKMTDVGLALIAAAKTSGLWDAPDRPNISLEVPDEFEQALSANAKARAFFNTLAPSYRKQYLGWIQVAKRPETRAKRVRESIALLEKGEKLGMR